MALPPIPLVENPAARSNRLRRPGATIAQQAGTVFVPVMATHGLFSAAFSAAFGDLWFPDSWQPSYPDRIPARKIAAANQMAWAPIDTKGLATAEFPGPDKWAASYPSKLLRGKPNGALLSVSGQAPIDTKGLTQPESTSVDRWGPRYPDRIPRRQLSTANQLAFAPIDARGLTQVELRLIDRWAPRYPDALRRGGPNQAILSVSGSVPISPWALTQPERTTLDRWGPQYVDRIPGRGPNAATIASSSSEAVRSLNQLELVFGDKWNPSFPDRIPRAQLAASNQMAFAPNDTKGMTLPEVPTGRYRSTFPDLLLRRGPNAALLSIAGQAPIDTTALTQKESVTVDRWQPGYVDRTRRGSPIGVILSITGQAPIDAAAMTRAGYVGVDAFGPTHPNRLDRRGPSGALLSVAGMAPVDARAMTQKESVSVDRWAPSYPDRLWRAPQSNQRAHWWLAGPLPVPLPTDFGFVVQAPPRIPAPIGIKQHQIESVVALGAITPPALVLVTWVD